MVLIRFVKNLSERWISIIVFSLFFSWLLAVPFEGQLLYSLAQQYKIDPYGMILGSITAHSAGLLCSGIIIKSTLAAKRWIMFSIIFCMFGSGVFFFEPTVLWNIVLISGSFLAGVCVAAWGFYFKSGTPSNERFKTAADVLILSNVLMILINTTAVVVLPNAGLGLSMFILGGALYFSSKLPDNIRPVPSPKSKTEKNNLFKALVFLCIFIILITFNSGLMYQVINPAFAHLDWLTSWYWAAPYIAALYILKNLPKKTSRNYMLYAAIAMIGFAFIAFMTFDRSAVSYLLINTLMLGACGINDLFWWSILGEMLDMDKNPAKILGIGLSSNVLGVMLGGFFGNSIITYKASSQNPSLLALVVVFVSLMLLPPLHKRLSKILKNHAFLISMPDIRENGQEKKSGNNLTFFQLTEREKEITDLLLNGRTYKMIANELYLSENTVKTHIKNIYSKLKVKSRSELVNLMLEKGLNNSAR